MRKPYKWLLAGVGVCVLAFLAVLIRGYVIVSREVREGNAFGDDLEGRAARLGVSTDLLGRVYYAEYDRSRDSDQALNAAERDVRDVYTRELQMLHGDERKALVATEVYFSPRAADTTR